MAKEDDGCAASGTERENGMHPGDEQPKFRLTPLDLELHDLIQEGYRFAPGSLERQKIEDRLVKRIQKAKCLYRPTAEEQPFYADALSVMWQYFFTHLWESETGRPFSQPGYWIVGRLNRRLRGELKDLRSESAKQDRDRQQPMQRDGEWTDPVDQIPAKADSALPPLEVALSDWLDTNAEIQQVCVRGRSQITGAIVIRRKLLDGLTWKTISADLGCSIPTLSAFFERECRSRLKQFCQDMGYRD